MSWNKIIKECDTISQYDENCHPERIMSLNEFLNKVIKLGISVKVYRQDGILYNVESIEQKTIFNLVNVSGLRDTLQK